MSDLHAFRQMDVEKVEKVQMRATRMIRLLRNCSYEDRLRYFNLPTLRYRHLRGDMIQVYNIISVFMIPDYVIS